MSETQSTGAPGTPFAYAPKAAAEILPCSTFNGETEETFVERVYTDTCVFAALSSSPDKARGTVLVFPPVSSRLRYLIHQIVETNLPVLKTFSVGSLERRTVVCRRDIYMMDNTQEKTPEVAPSRVRKQRAVNERAIYRPPPARTVGAPPEAVKPNQEPAALSPNGKKPSQEIYVPPCRKYSSALKTEQTEEAVENGIESKSVPVLVTIPKVTGRKAMREEARVAIEEDISKSPTWNKEETTQAPPTISRKISRSESIPVVKEPAKLTVDVGDLMESSELAELSNQVPLDKPIPSPSRYQKEISYDEDSWEKLYNESGDFLKPDAMEELTLAVGAVRIVEPRNEIYSQVSENPDEDLSHVVEVYDFPSAFKTEDIYNALNVGGKQGDFSLKWVDDTHALAVYSNTSAAMDALALNSSLVKVRPLAQATKESRNTARRIASALLPYKPRPATSATMAKRLVSGALGIKSIVSPEQRQKERKMLADAKERKRLAAQQREAAWEGTLAATP